MISRDSAEMRAPQPVEMLELYKTRPGDILSDAPVCKGLYGWLVGSGPLMGFADDKKGFRGILSSNLRIKYIVL